MDSGFTITFTGREKELKSVFFPPIDLDGSYVIGLVDFQSYNSIFNVRKPLNKIFYYDVKTITTPKGNDITIEQLNASFKDKLKIFVKDKVPYIKTNVKLIFSKGLASKLDKITEQTTSVEEDLYYYDHKEMKEIEIPEGSYEIHEIIREIQKHLPNVIITANTSTMKATILSGDVLFDFNKPGVATHLLGFRGMSTPGIPYETFDKVKINNINVIRVKCDIANGSYLNGKLSHTIHSFYPEAPPGYKMIEVPRNILYFPVNKRTLDVITVTFADQYDHPIDFNGEEVTITCHIKKLI